MAKLSFWEKFIVNRVNKYFYNKAFSSLEKALTLSSASSVLEVGSGNGSLALLVIEKYRPARLFVTDYDEEQVKLAEKNLQEIHGSVPSNCVLERADALNLQYPDEAFDSVLAFMVFHYFGKHVRNLGEVYKGLNEIVRVLKRGGQIVYAEMFNKKKVRDYLLSKGFEISYRKSYAGIIDLVAAIKPG